MRTGTPLMARSVRTGWISMVTRTLCGTRSLARLSGIPILTVSRTSAADALSSIGSVVTSVSSRRALSGPTTSTLAG